MSEAGKRWRCPYCDGLNDWQNETCEICGDGRRTEAEAAGKAAGMPKTYAPNERKSVEEAPKHEAETETRAETKPTCAPPPPPAPEPKKKGKAGILVAIVMVALAAFAGRQLADGFVASMNQPEPTSLVVINTPVPTKALTKTTTKAATKVPVTPTPVPEKTSRPVSNGITGQVIATFGVPDKPLASIESITLNDNGTALLKLRGNGCPQTEFSVHYCILKSRDEDPKLASWKEGNEGYIDLNPWHPFMLARDLKDSLTYRGPLDEAALVRVFPGCWMEFYVIDGDFHKDAYWTTGPVYIPESVSTAAPPLRLTDVKMGFNEVGGYDIESYYSLTSARDLNNAMKAAREEDRPKQLYAEYTLKMECSMDEYEHWYNAKQMHKVNAVLFAPDFVEIDTTQNFFSNSSNINGESVTYRLPSVLDISYKDPREGIGWYPPGDYTLVFYIDGVSVGSYAFTLAGKGGAKSASQSASTPASHVFPLKVGSKGREVRHLQEALMVLDGDFKGPADGIFGAKTEKAVLRQQDAAGFDHTGTVDLEQYRRFTVSAGILSESDFK